MLTPFGTRTAAQILADFGLPPPPPGKDRYYTTCPKCSRNRSTAAHRKEAVLGVTIDNKGVKFGCNHCDWTGGDFFDLLKSNGLDSQSPFAAVYDYVDESGALLFQVCRKRNKEWFPQRRPDGKGGWNWNLGDVRKVLYRLPDVIEALANDRTVLVVEGEKDVDNAWKLGIPATCNSGGAGKWLGAHSEALRGADIVIIPDDDEPGYAHADAVARMCAGIAKRIRTLKLAAHWPECPKGGDLSDWLKAGHTREELDALIEAATEVEEASEPGTRRGIDGRKNVQVRATLRPVGEMARRTKVAILSITHFNKGTAGASTKALYRVIDSVAFTAAPRAAFTVMEDPEDENIRLVLHLKNNLGPKPDGLAFRIFSDCIVGSDDEGDFVASYVSWESKSVKTTADEALNAGSSGEPTAKGDAVEFLRTVLADGAVAVPDLEVEARAAGYLRPDQSISQSKPFRAARKALGIDPYQAKGVKAGGWFWALPEHQMPSEASDALQNGRASDGVEGI